MRKYLSSCRWQTVGLCVLTVLQSMLQVAMALLSRFVIDSALSDGAGLSVWAWLLVANVLCLVGFHGWLMWLTGAITDRLSAKLRQDILAAAVISREAVFVDHHSGALLNRSMEDVHTVCDGAVNVIPALVGQITRLAAAFAAVLFISVPVAIVLLVGAVVVGVLTACLRPILKKRHHAVRKSDEALMSTLQEDLQQLEVIQSLGIQEQIEKRFAGKTRDNLRVRLQRRIWSVTAGSVLSTGIQLGSGALLLWGAVGVAAQTISYGSLTALLQLVSLFRGPVLGISGLWTRLTAVDVASERLQELLADRTPPAEPVQAGNIKEIVFENVTFSYPGEEAPVLENFSFQFPLENWACLTGVSGKGKTTIFKLILGLHTPQTGRIFLRTEDGEFSCTEATRHLFAYVPQDYVLFSGTIEENLRLAVPEAKTEQIENALAAAGAEFVWELADGLQTQVRENNAGLSKGQLQRLAIARAVLMDRRVFLLDECSSALDADTEGRVLQGLKALGKQTILVTHRPEALQMLENVEQISIES